ncbi:MAG: hypothetical protein EP347_10360 [Alphaproteobacteria bacterium]|nr:MAG: hypothetical protein EP347_10360 [Alphaproteobacteria bacterium]
MAAKSKTLSVEEQRAAALDILLDAWDAALEKEISGDALARMAIFAALTDMIDQHGEEMALELVESLPARIKAGEFTLSSK